MDDNNTVSIGGAKKRISAKKESGSAQPGQAAQTQPGQAAQTQPGQAAQTQPGQAAQTQPGGSAQPGQAAQTQPGSSAQQQPNPQPNQSSQPVTIENDTRKIIDDLGRIIYSVESKESVTVYPQPETEVPQYITETSKKEKIRNTEFLISTPGAPFQYQEAFHSLRTNIKYLASDTECRKIVVTSSIPGEGKSIVSLNLALALAAANNSVVLIDADLRKPMIHSYLGIEEGLSMGLTNIMSGAHSVKDCMYSFIDKPNLHVIPCGMIPLNPTEILGSRRMGNFIGEMASSFDYVIIDTAPVSVVTDAAVLNQFVDGVLLVVRQKLVTFEQAKRARKNLDAVGANIIGAVLNDFNIKHLESASEYNYYNYYYNYEHGNYGNKGDRGHKSTGKK